MTIETASQGSPSYSSTDLDSATEARLQRIWKKAYAARHQGDLEDLYAEWAETYDQDHDAIGYFGHAATADVFARHVDDPASARVLDAGAGTGAGGVELARRGFEKLSALDLSEAMLEKARDKGVFEDFHQADLDDPLDFFECDRFDGAILVGVFSYGQAPAHALEEIVRVVKPGGTIAFTLRLDFFESDAMGVRSKIEELEAAGAWRQIELSEPRQYLPKKDPDVMFRVWCFEVLEGKRSEIAPEFLEEARRALMEPESVRRLDHAHIWDPMASRLYNRYIANEAYYLNECEKEILRTHAEQIAGEHSVFVELGCGSADKIRLILDAALETGREISYLPIDLSAGALEATAAEIEETYGGRVHVATRLGRFRDRLSEIPAENGKDVFFFGSSISNIETLEDTVSFLRELRDVMTPRDRLQVGFDLQKDPAVLLRAYNAGPDNLAFFLHMVRRMNHDLGANFELGAFRLGSTYDKEPPWGGLEPRCVHLKVVTEVAQEVHVPGLGLDLHLEPGDAIQVGKSRKWSAEDIRNLAPHAGLRLQTLRLDQRHYFSLAELVRDDAERG